MAWSTLPTYTSGSVLTAAQMNAIAANINETSAATVTTAGDMTYADAANSMGNRLAIGGVRTHMVSTGSAPVWREATSASGSTSYVGTSTSYVPLDTFDGTGSAISITLTTGVAALILIDSLRVSNATAGAQTFLAYDISGASTVAAADSTAAAHESTNANDATHISVCRLQTGLTAGTNVFEVYAQVSSGTGTIGRPRLTVIAF